MRPRRTCASLRAIFAFDKFYPEKLKRRASFVSARAPRLQNLPANKHRTLAQAPKYAAFGYLNAASANSRRDNETRGEI